jgi:hypothetical protein
LGEVTASGPLWKFNSNCCHRTGGGAITGALRWTLVTGKKAQRRWIKEWNWG